MDWTFEGNMAKYLFCATLTGCRGGHTHLYKQKRKRPTSLWRRLSRIQVLLGRVISGGLGAGVADESAETCGLSAHPAFHWRSAYCSSHMLLFSAWASEGGHGGPSRPGFWNYWQKKLFFSISRGKKKISPLLAPLGKNFGKIPTAPLEKILPTSMVVRWTDEMLYGGYKWVSRFEAPCVCTRWTGERRVAKMSRLHGTAC